MNKIEPQPDPLFELSKTVRSLQSRTLLLEKEDSTLDHSFESKAEFWKNQTKDFKRLTTSLNIDIANLKKGLSENAMYTERILVDFRNKIKKDRIENLRNAMDAWQVDKFVTQKRFYEILEHEIKSQKE